MKTLADSMTKILMHLEIRKKNEHPKQKFAENSDASMTKDKENFDKTVDIFSDLVIINANYPFSEVD